VGDTLGHLWPLFRMFLDENPAERQGGFGYAFNNTFFDEGAQHIMAKLLEHVGVDALSILVDPKDELESFDDIVRTRCYAPERYSVREELDNRGVSAACTAQAQHTPLSSDPVCCHYNEQCNATSQVCTASGLCEDMHINIENMLTETIEVGVTCAACGAVDQGQFSGASPWRRMGDILEQHGMCSHLNRVTYERMDDLLSERHEALGCTRESAAGEDSQQPWLHYWVCPREAINWTWVRERPGFIYGENERTASLTLDTRQNQIETSVLTDGLFDLHPHLCDAEYMHSHTLSWCQLEHHGTATSAGASASTSSGEYGRWMRTAHQHKDFSTLRPIQPDIRDKGTAPFEKMRFMGMNNAMLKKQAENSGVREVIAVQQCGALGVCQTEAFTFAGIHCVRKRHVLAAANSGPLLPSSGDPKTSTTMDANDMIRCGPMGYIDSEESGMCVLDPLVVPMAYVLESIASPGTGNACRTIFQQPSRVSGANGYTIDRDRGLIRYNAGRQDFKPFKLLLNSYMLADVSVLRNAVADTEDDRRNLNTDIILCSEVLHSFIDTNTQGEELYGRHHVQGLYVFLDWGSYEIPIFWWLKLVISKWVYRMKDSQQIRLADLDSDIPIDLAAFDERI